MLSKRNDIHPDIVHPRYSPQPDNLNVAFFGMRGLFSYHVLAELLAAGTPVAVVVVADPSPKTHPPSLVSLLPDEARSPLPLLTPFVTHTIAHLAWQHRIPVYEACGIDQTALQALLQRYESDVACVACFPYRFPATVLDALAHGFLNVHPSLLPAYRGPAPIFWALRNGETTIGVTIHWMDSGLDTGDIAAQQSMSLTDGLTGPEIDQRCAVMGADLLVTTLNRLLTGTHERAPQPPGGTYQPWPTANDFTLSTAWSARRAFNFMQGTLEWNMPYRINVDGTWLELGSAVRYESNMSLSRPYIRHGSELLIQFTPGVLIARELKP